MSKNDDKRLEKLRNKRQARASEGVADWQSARAEFVLRAIAAVAFRGGALRFGYTRDGGAFAIGIYLSNDHYTEYVRPNEDVDQYLLGLIEDMEHWGTQTET